MRRVCKVVLFGVAGLWLGAVAGPRAGVAQTGAPPPRMAEGEFVPAGGALACQVTSTAKLPPALIARLGSQPCLHIGDVAVGDARQRVEQVLGPDDGAPVVTDDGLTYRYALRAADASQAKPPFYAVTFRKGGVSDAIASDVELSGPASVPAVGFAGIKLGDPSGVVLERLGPPARRTPVPEAGSDRWTYDPHLISIEIKNGVVSSIKIAYRAASR